MPRPKASRPTRKPRCRWRRLVRTFLLSSIFLAMLLLSSVYFLIPWLGQRGDLNGFFERAIASTFNFPIQVGSIQSAPLSELTLTQLRGVSGSAAGKLDLQIEEISFYYDPIDLFSGHVKRTTLVSPSLFINLDENLAGIVQAPEITTSSARTFSQNDDFLPITIGETDLRSGSATVQFSGRKLELENLRLRVFDLGRATGQRFELEFDVFGAHVHLWGNLDIDVSATDVRYGFQDTNISVRQLSVSRFSAWCQSTVDDEDQACTKAPANPYPASDPLAMSLAPTWTALSHVSGLLSLNGKLRGVWPERIQIDLDSTTTHVAADYRSFGLTGGESELTLSVTTLDACQLSSFHLGLTAAGRVRTSDESSREVITLDAQGQFARTSPTAGTLRLSDLRFQLGELGALTLRGDIGSIGNSTGPPAIDVAVSVEQLRLARFLTLLPPRTRFFEQLHVTSGSIDTNLRVTGALDQTQIDGSFAIGLGGSMLDSSEALTVALKGDVRELSIDSQQGIISVEHLQARSALSAAQDLFVLAPADCHPEAYGLAVDSLDTVVTLEVLNGHWSANKAHGNVGVNVQVSDAALTAEEGWIEAVEVDIDLALETEFDGERDSQPFALAVELGFAEALVGDVFVESPEETTRLNAKGTWTSNQERRLTRVRADALTLAGPYNGTTIGSAELRVGLPGSAPWFQCDTRTLGMPTRRLFSTLVTEPLQESLPWLEDAALDGDLALTLLAEGYPTTPSVSARAELTNGSFRRGDLSLEGIEAQIPFAFHQAVGPPGEPQDGRLRVARVSGGGVELVDLHVPFQKWGDNYALTAPVEATLFGGHARIQRLDWIHDSDGDPTWRGEISATDLDLEQVTRTLGWTVVPGRVSFGSRPVHVRGGRVEWNGTLRIDAFGGNFTVQDFAAEDLFRPYFSLKLGSGTLRNVHMHDLGKTFNFGVMSGVLNGQIDDVAFTAGELTGFRFDVAAVPTRGVKQFIDRRGVQNLQRTLEGKPADIQAGFFSKFSFDDFGFTAHLDDDDFRLNGKYKEGDVEYIMRARWYRNPQISIINGNPGRAYDWQWIVKNLHEVYVQPGTSTRGKEN